jgi:glycolate oxidase iron-sulfur subunit
MRESARAGAVTGILALADQCVMCGLCLPHCPTYRLTLNEAESPRGRIALARSMAAGTLAPTPAGLAHLDHCLACLSCEPVCPSGVRYGAILVASRSELAARRPRPGLARRLLRKPALLVAATRLGVALRARHWLVPLARLLPRASILRRAIEILPDRPPSVPRPADAPAAVPTRGRVALFRGCVASVADRDTHEALARLLAALGYEVAVPPGTPCCGALARHAGDDAACGRQWAAAARAIAATGAETVLVSASGCFGTLREGLAEVGSACRVADAAGFLAADAGMERLDFRPLAATAVLHVPCTERNVVGGEPAIRALLARIPDLVLRVLPVQPKCCGAAGDYMLEQPGFADRLRAEKLDQVAALEPDLLLTSNIGCRLHLGNGLEARESAVPVLHPLVVLARQLGQDGASSPGMPS